MKIGLLTYDRPHKKTQDVCMRLALLGYSDIEVIAQKWIDKPAFNPLFQHRPNGFIDVPVKKMCENLRMLYHELTDLPDFLSKNKYDKILICGASILPKEVLKYNIINSHPGYLPNVRGLDALKWAILEGHPVGVTTYVIGELPDTGFLIERKIIGRELNDSLMSLGWKVYNTEIEMLVASIEQQPTNVELWDSYPLHGRMSHHTEIMLKICK